MKTIVITTINIPKNLYEFISKAKEEWTPIVVGDLKSPHEEIEKICKETRGVYLSPEKQMTLGFTHASSIPWNCYDRKNIGYLFALKEKTEVVFSTDDDNYPPDNWDSYLKLGKQEVDTIYSESGWFNYFSLSDNPRITPRGYPIGLDSRSYRKKSEQNIVIQSGLVIGDPDVDALTRAILHPEVTRYQALNFALGKGTVSPYNSQATLISKEMLPVSMLWNAPYTGFYRYDDIFAGYVGQIIASHYNKTVMFGNPIMTQTRNYHNSIKDIRSELEGIEIQEKFVSLLKGIDLKGKTPLDNLHEIVYYLTESIPELPKQYRLQVDTWYNDIERIGT